MTGSRDNYCVSEAAALLKVSPSTVRRWIKTGKLPAQRVGPKTIRIKQEDLTSVQQSVTPQTGDGDGRYPSGSSMAMPVEDAGLYRLMVENAKERIGLYNLEGRFIYASPYYLLKFSYAPEEQTGRIAFTFIHPDDRAAAQAARLHMYHRMASVGKSGSRKKPVRLSRTGLCLR
jgi:excisionase family DNA binding protein